MNDYYSGRSSRPARLFSFGLLDGPQKLRCPETAGSRGHGPLTISRASTPMTRLIRRVMDLADAHKRGALYPSRRAPCEKPTGTDVSWRAWGWAGEMESSVSAASRRRS
jgi:hypothetical protein